MSKKRVLIVDDAKDILFLLTHSVKRLGPEYEVSTATDGPTALEKIQKHKFDLIITDYMMPGMTGLQLTEEVRQRSPETQVVLMTAYDTATVRDRAEDMHIGSIVGKPFTVPQIMGIIKGIITRTNQAPEAEPAEATVADEGIYEHLKNLYNKTGAHYVLLLDAEGYPLQVVGQADRTKVSRLASFIAANFMAITELASLLDDDDSVFTSSYYEGSNYNIYAHDVNKEFLLAIVFGTTGKPGTVWFYTKQTATTLASLLSEDTEATQVKSSKGTVAKDFEDLVGDEEKE